MNKKARATKTRTITSEELQHLGYTQGAVIQIGENKPVSVIVEMRNDQDQQASFCLLRQWNGADGVIIPKPFVELLGQHSFDLSEYQTPDFGRNS